MAETKAKELRKEAKNLGVKGWDKMSKDELKAAIEAANTNGSKPKKSKKSASKAKAEAPAKSKAKTKKSESKAAEGVNPFRQGTNLYFITEALIKGGKRSELIRKLRDKLEYNPRVQAEADFDPDEETDRRLKAVGYILKNTHGFEYVHEGRGRDAFIQARPR